MIFYYIRHGNPIYDPDSLTPLGERQAEAVGRRLAQEGIDRIFASTSTRAKLTAKPLSEILRKSVTDLDFANEGHAWQGFAAPSADGRCTRWSFQQPEYRRLFHSAEVRMAGFAWADVPSLKEKFDFAPGVERVYRETDAFFASLGYEHERYTGRYRVVKENNERIALFAHQGFGLAFLSALLDIPYPVFSTQFDMTHTGVTIIDFKNEDGYAIPRLYALSDTGHLYRDALPVTL